MTGLRRRIGTFFSFVGVAVMALFFASDLAREPNFSLFFWGIITLGLGYLLLRGTSSAPEKSSRFRLIRKIFSRGKKKKGDDGNKE